MHGPTAGGWKGGSVEDEVRGGGGGIGLVPGPSACAEPGALGLFVEQTLVETVDLADKLLMTVVEGVEVLQQIVTLLCEFVECDARREEAVGEAFDSVLGVARLFAGGNGGGRRGWADHGGASGAGAPSVGGSATASGRAATPRGAGGCIPLSEQGSILAGQDPERGGEGLDLRGVRVDVVDVLIGVAAGSATARGFRPGGALEDGDRGSVSSHMMGGRARGGGDRERKSGPTSESWRLRGGDTLATTTSLPAEFTGPHESASREILGTGGGIGGAVKKSDDRGKVTAEVKALQKLLRLCRSKNCRNLPRFPTDETCQIFKTILVTSFVTSSSLKHVSTYRVLCAFQSPMAFVLKSDHPFYLFYYAPIYFLDVIPHLSMINEGCITFHDFQVTYSVRSWLFN